MKEIHASEHRTRLEELFRRAVSMPHGEREAFLKEECSDSPDLFREVMALLAQDEAGTKEYLLSPVQDRVRAVDTDQIAGPPTSFPGKAPRQIGGFRILARIGEGGMGRVFLAVDRDSGQRVALKVVRVGANVSRVLRRFQHEREVLSAMRHPNICRILGGGATEDGLPWFAMEFVEDARVITDYVREERLDVAARLALFGKVCDAVGHGHGRGFLHRDLKPSNILVGPDGEPKLIDFGIARSFGEGSALSTLTESGQLLGTLQYMAPEQLELNESLLDVRCDVYSLGVVLYELVTGRLPYDVDGFGIVEAARIIREQPPLRPAAIDPALKGDLATILEKALEKEPDRRYATVRDLALDVQAYCESRPIAARPPSSIYQARLFLRRHPSLFVGVAVSSLSLIAVALVSVRWAAREERSRREAEAITSFLASSLESVDPRRVATIPSLLARMEARLEEEFEGRPEVRGQLLAMLARAHHGLGDRNRAEEQLREAVGLLTETVGYDDPRTLHARLSWIQVSENPGKGTGEELSEVLDEMYAVLGRDHPDTLAAESALASLRLEQGRFEEAEGLLQHAIEGYTKIRGPRDFDALGAQAALAGLYQTMGRTQEADRLFEEVVEAEEEVFGRPVPNTLNGLALLRIDQGRFEQAERILEDVVEFESENYGVDHPWTLLARYNLASLYLERGRLEEAEAELVDVYERQLRVLGAESAETLASLNGLGRIALARGELRAAATVLGEVVEGARELDGRDLELGTYLTDLGICLGRLGRIEEARSRLREGLELLEGTVGGTAPESRTCRQALARLEGASRAPEGAGRN